MREPHHTATATDFSVLIDLVARDISIVEAYPHPEDRRQALAGFTATPSLAHLSPLPLARPIAGWPELPASNNGRVSSRVAIVTPDIVGPIRNGGIGTAYASLAEALAEAGHAVTILYTLGAFCENGTIDEWVAYYQKRRIEFVPLPEIDTPAVVQGAYTSYAAYRWLAARQFDCVHFPEWSGAGFCSVKAKHLGLAFEHTLLCVGVHSPTLWHDLGDRRPIDRHEQLEIDYREQRSVELADVAIAPSQHILQWIAERGWRVPERTYVWPYVAPQIAPLLTVHRSPVIREVVFFGRLESRKGLEVFCDAIDRLERRAEVDEVSVTFLGKSGFVDTEEGLSYLSRRASPWKRRWQALTDLSRQEALDYLVSRDVLAVMPSVADNTPNTVLECMAAGVPFLASDAGGIPEMINEADRPSVLFGHDADALAAAVVDRVSRGAHTARPARDPADICERWIAWHAGLGGARPPSTDEATNRPLVTVCMATRNRPQLLAQALASIRHQTYPNVEVVLVDDGSDVPAARAALEDLRGEFVSRKWTLVCGNRQFPGAARNAAAARAHGRYLLFMDDDNVARPEELEVFVRAAERSGAAMLTCANDRFKGEDPPSSNNRLAEGWMPIGPALPLALFTNCVGDTNMLVRRESFFSAGGFDEDPGVGVEDWTLLIKALVRGLHVEALPEILYDYRVSADAFGQQFHPYERRMRAIRPVLDLLPRGIGLGLLYASSAAGAMDHETMRAFSASASARRRANIHRWLVRSLRPHSQGSDQGSHLAERFDKALSRTSYGVGGQRQLMPLGQVVIKPVMDTVCIRSLGNEPRLALSGPALQRGPLVVRLDVTTPRTAMAQIFWKTLRAPFYCEEQSIRVTLPSGRNTHYVRIPAATIVGPLRFDPTTRAEQVVLHALDVCRDAAR